MLSKNLERAICGWMKHQFLFVDIYWKWPKSGDVCATADL